MSFRKIRPSFADSSASASNPSVSTSESTSSDPHRARTGKGLESSSSTSSKRRRVPETVTRNACVNCKKARAKCDGKRPCKRCASRVDFPECVYEVHIKHAKEELVRQIKALMTKDHLTEQILQALSSDEQVPEIIERLKKGETYDAIVEWLGRSPIAEFETLSPQDSHHSAIEPTDHDMDRDPPAFQWTSVTADTAVLDHLFQLYFAWVHPVHTLFSEGHFVDSYNRQSTTYCSPNLVNSICAMACHLHSVASADEIDFEHLGVEFSDAFRANIDAEDTSVTTIQSFAVMFIVDSSRASSLRASSYLKLATENLSAVSLFEGGGFSEVLACTARGVRNLNIEWSQITFQVPPALQIDLLDTGDDEYDESHDTANWYFYRYINDQCPAWPGLLGTTNHEKVKLVAIISDATTMMYDQHSPGIAAEHVLKLYSRLITWRNELPDVLGNIENNNSQPLPHVLSLLILFSNSMVQLLRPLLDLKGFPASLVEEVIWRHAQSGLFLLDEQYRTQYTCRYQPVLQMFAILHLTDVVARFFPEVEGSGKNGPEAVQFGMETLMESRVGFPVAGPFQEMLRRRAVNLSVALPENLYELMSTSGKPQAYQLDDMFDACTRSNYIQPIPDIHKRYLPSFSADWASHGASFGFPEPSIDAKKLRPPSAEERGAQSLMQIRNLLNTN